MDSNVRLTTPAICHTMLRTGIKVTYRRSGRRAVCAHHEA
jgi:hypothetical protein